MSPGDITITAAHREVMRRLDQGEGEYLTRAEVRTMARDLLALIDWLDHEDAVRAQDGGS